MVEEALKAPSYALPMGALSQQEVLSAETRRTSSLGSCSVFETSVHSGKTNEKCRFPADRLSVHLTVKSGTD